MLGVLQTQLWSHSPRALSGPLSICFIRSERQDSYPQNKTPFVGGTKI